MSGKRRWLLMVAALLAAFAASSAAATASPTRLDADLARTGVIAPGGLAVKLVGTYECPESEFGIGVWVTVQVRQASSTAYGQFEQFCSGGFSGRLSARVSLDRPLRPGKADVRLESYDIADGESFVVTQRDVVLVEAEETESFLRFDSFASLSADGRAVTLTGTYACPNNDFGEMIHLWPRLFQGTVLAAADPMVEQPPSVTCDGTGTPAAVNIRLVVVGDGGLRPGIASVDQPYGYDQAMVADEIFLRHM